METLTSHQFYQKKDKLEPGAYSVIEHDNTVSIAVIHGSGYHRNVKWMSPEEYDESQLEEERDRMWEYDDMDFL